MPQIIVSAIDETHFQVTVVDSSTHIRTLHDVSVAPDYALKLTANNITNAQLVEKSFEFLLTREANTSILSNFDLSIIARYFPEFERMVAC